MRYDNSDYGAGHRPKEDCALCHTNWCIDKKENEETTENYMVQEVVAETRNFGNLCHAIA